LKDYQLEGFRWLVYCWFHHRNTMLADEMGLGKTIQSIAVLEYLRVSVNIRGPFLIIAPLSTLFNWQREIESWTDMNVVVFHGSAASREIIKKHEIHFKVFFSYFVICLD
jgi:chromodomain-helicase-DNA-binding protein 7